MAGVAGGSSTSTGAIQRGGSLIRNGASAPVEPDDGALADSAASAQSQRVARRARRGESAAGFPGQGDQFLLLGGALSGVAGKRRDCMSKGRLPFIQHAAIMAKKPDRLGSDGEFGKHSFGNSALPCQRDIAEVSGNLL